MEIVFYCEAAIFDCFDLSVLGLEMKTNGKADLCIQALENALIAHPALEDAVMIMYAVRVCRTEGRRNFSANVVIRSR